MCEGNKCRDATRTQGESDVTKISGQRNPVCRNGGNDPLTFEEHKIKASAAGPRSNKPT